MGSEQTQFKPGQSGNPKGRRKGRTGKQAILHKLAEQLMKSKDGNITYEDAIVEALINAAVAGYSWAIKLLFQYKVGLPIPRDRAEGTEDLPVKLVFNGEDIDL